MSLRSKIVKQIFKKEMLDILRDKKTIFMMIILPIILYPLIMFGTMQIMTTTMSNMEKQEINIGVSNIEDETLIYKLGENLLEKESGKLNIIEVDDYEKALDEGEISAYIEGESNNSSTKYKIYTNFSDDNSSVAKNRIEEILNAYKEELVISNLNSEGLDSESILEPITYESIDIAKNEEMAGYFLGQILPIILIIGVLLGAIYPAIDVMAGEKERGTLETLFTLPISNLELVMGKYMAVSCSAIVTALLNVISIFGTIMFIMASGSLMMEDTMAKFNFTQLILPIVITLVCICLFAMVISAVSMCVCSLAKSFKEAQNYITPVMLIVMIPAYVSMIPNMVLNSKTAVIPVVNISLLIKSVMNFNTNLDLIALVLVSNIIFAIVSILLLSKMFNSEEILFGDGRTFSFLEKRSNLQKGSMPTFSDGALLYCIGLVLLIYVGSYIQTKYGMIGLAMTQVMIISIPLLLAYYIKSDMKNVFSLRIPSFKNIMGAVVLWMGTYFIVMIISNILLTIFPQTLETAEALNNFIFGNSSFITTFLIVAVMPAICEEMFFRGFLLSAFRSRLSARNAIILSGLLFGFMHIYFIKIIPTAILGASFAYAVYKSKSIYVSMLMHLLNNGFAVVVSQLQTMIPASTHVSEVSFWDIGILNIGVILVVGLLLMKLGSVLLNNKKTGE